MYQPLLRVFSALSAALVLAAAPADAGPAEWTDLEKAPDRTLALPPLARPVRGRTVRLDVPAVARRLAVAPRSVVDLASGRLLGATTATSNAVIELPTPEGGVERFRFVESPVLPGELQAKYPDIRTYIGQGIDNPAATVHFDLTPLGFHAQVFTPTPRGVPGIDPDRAGAWYIDPVSRGDIEHYAIYRHGDLPGGGPLVCSATAGEPVHGNPVVNTRGPGGEVLLHVVRIAVAATGEYTAYHSLPNPPNQIAGIAAVATSINRVNQVYMRDLAVQLILAVNNDSIIYVDAATDPFTPPAGSPTGTVPVLSDVKAQNPRVINANIPAGQWDIGHCVHATPTGAGFFGQASIGGVCGPSAASAASTSGLPNGTYFWIGLLGHEIGHQLGGTHTFNGVGDTCSRPGEYTPSSAIEPGSGTTIMSYAGNCDSDNILAHSPMPAGGGLPETAALPMFGAYSIDQINQWLAMNFCGFNVQTGNHRPFVPALGTGTWLIPANTPFRLNVADAGDPDGQATSVSWEQFNIGAQRPLGPDTGANEPLMRTYLPSSDTERIFPVLPTALGGAPRLGENLPRFDRTMYFRAVSRDNFAQGGGVTQGQVTVGVWRTPGDAAFRVTAPGAGAQFCAGQNILVQWDPVGTAGPPVNAGTVDITLSLDGGQTWPVTLAAGVPNSGQATVIAPGLTTVRGRIKVEPVNNIFFSINPSDISISSGPPSVTTQPVDQAVCPGQTVTLGFVPGPNPGSIQWFKNGAPFAGVNTSTITFLHAASSDSGDYSATITNGCGQATTRTARLQVGVSIDNLAGMPATPVQPCSPVTAQVQARGVGALTYRWYRNGIPLADGDGITGSATATLSLGGARYGSEGLYEVLITDSCGPRRYTAGELAVAGPSWVHKSVSPAPGGAGQASAGWTMAHDEDRGVTVMYGGFNSSGHYVNSLWEFDGTTWAARYDSSNSLAVPQPGQGFFNGTVCPSLHAAVYSPDHHAVFLVVGAGSSFPLRIWRWDGAAWSTVADRAGSGDGNTLWQAAYDRHRHLIVIVRVSGNGGPAEVLEFDPTTLTFTQGPTPPQANGILLYESRLYYDQTRQAVILYDPPGNFDGAAVYAYTGTWTTLSGVPLTLGRWTPLEYDPVRQQGVGLSGDEIGPSCGQWYTGTFTFPGSLARFGSVNPLATDWSIPLPDGAPRNPSGAGQSPDNAFSARMLAFDTRRRAMLAVGGRGMSSVSCGTSTWDMWERRYLDLPVFDTQPPGAPVLSGQTLTLTAIPVGAPTMTLRWRRNGQVLANGPLAGFPGTSVSGATTGTLTVTGPGAAETASYRLEAVNGCGSVFSTPAIVGTLPPGDFNQDGAISVQDIFDFLGAYFAGDARADINHSGSVTVQDIFDFLAAYFAG